MEAGSGSRDRVRVSGRVGLGVGLGQEVMVALAPAPAAGLWRAWNAVSTLLWSNPYSLCYIPLDTPHNRPVPGSNDLLRRDNIGI
jgi:hypothetical protein